MAQEHPASGESTSLQFIPLGGLGEIGMNCFCLQQDGQILVVDCGIGFPDDDVGVDVVHPDFDWLTENASSIVGLFITHGHEDHIGAIPFFIDGLGSEIPIYAPRHALELIRSRLEQKGRRIPKLQRVDCGQSYQVGDFLVEPIEVAHSIIDATALHIQTKIGSIIHTGDFDLDEVQPAGHLTNGRRFRQLGDEGVRLLLSDSTNVVREQRSGHEGDVGVALKELIAAQTGRVVVGLFSSNVHRLDQLVKIALSSRRRLCLLGRSLRKQFEIAMKLGVIDVPPHCLIPPESLADLPPEQVLVLAGGSQGEGPSALRRLSLAQHPLLRLEKGDTVLFSSRVIPGNERGVAVMKNDFLRQGVKVQDQKNAPQLHVSGHASREEQRKMIEWVRPQTFIPVHGTLYHMQAHELLARDLGVSSTFTIENGQVVSLEEAQAYRAGSVPAGKVRVAYGGQTLDARTRRHRIELGRNGVVSVSVVINQQGEMIAGPQLRSYGVPGLERDGLRASIEKIICEKVKDKVGQASLSLSEVIRRAVRSEIYRLSGVKPPVEVHLHRTGADKV
ncbi:MAG: ribonuclease J [Polyangiaceae bacterium]|nr:ribonuclease J [Polyangiaceae bacterium]